MAIRIEFWGTGAHHTLSPRHYEDGQVAVVPVLGDIIEIPFDGEPNRERGRFKVEGRIFRYEGLLTVVNVFLEIIYRKKQ